MRISKALWGGFLFVMFSFFCSISVSGQTLSLNDGSVLRSNPSRIGLNLGTMNYYDNGQMLKNLIGSMNPGFEPVLQQQIWNLSAAGTTTTFTVPDQYDGVPANYWAGGTFTVYASQSGATAGCTGTIASNTGPNYPTWVGTTAPVVTISSPCAGAFGPGDIVMLSKTFTPTPESWWEASQGGFWASVSGGGKLTSNTTDLCATCGTQTLDLDATAAGSSSSANFFFDTDSQDIFVLMNGTFQISLWAKSASGTPIMSVSASRGATGGFNCGTYKPALTSTWTQYTYTCTATESQAATAIGNAGMSVNVTGGAAYLDNVSFMKVAPSDSSNTTVFRDEVIDTIKQWAAPGAGPRMVLRDWLGPMNAETMYNWTQPDYARYIVSAGTGYFAQPSGGGSLTLSLEDYLEICQTVGADPYFVVPVTFSTADAANLIEFLAGSSSTTYGARRAALGQVEPWTSVFGTIHLEFGNEDWNFSSFAGQALPSRSNAPNATNPEYYYDYSVRAAQIFSAMRGAPDYSASAFDLIMNAQTAVNWSMDTGIARAHPDSLEIEGYLYQDVSSFATDAALWGPAMLEPYENVTNPSDIANFYQSVHDYQSQTTCGANGTSTCKVNSYEWGQGTLPGTGIDQPHMDEITAGAGQAVITALEPLLKMQYYGMGPQAFFALASFNQNGSPSPKLWGNVIDMGGATNNVRPTFLGPQLVNQAIIGPMFSCPITSGPTYSFAGSPNGPGAALPALTGVPYVYAFCFMNGNERSIVLINTDLSNAYTISFAGTNPPTGAVNVRQIAPSSLDELNEAPTGTPTNQTPATVVIDSSSLSSPSSFTLPPHSVSSLDYTAGGAAPSTLAQPTISPAGGTYSSAQTVSINESTAGTTVYYTTNGTTPTTSSAVYGGPITVSTSETVQAIAVETGYANSTVASAVFTINNGLAAPVISPAAGTYSSAQTVSITDSTAGATIYYTTNGTVPSTSSTVYSGPISVSSSETVEAIAVEAGYSNSPVASAAYTINKSLPAPVISPAAGTYSSTQTVNITDSTAGTTIYYTTNGTTPSTSSAVYSGPISVSTSETVEAIAVESGYTNSAVASAAYTINNALAAPVISPAAGTYSSAQTVSISDSTAGATIYYTTNGTAPSTSSAVYSGPISVSASETVAAIAVETGYTVSPVASASYTINTALPAPAFSPASGTYTGPQSVTITESMTGSTIYYTTDGSAPTTSSRVYSSPVMVSASTTMTAVAVKSGHGNSPTSLANYTIKSTLPTPAFSPASGTYTTVQTVTISDATAGTTIYYTTNGTPPTTSSTLYAGPISVDASETLQAIAVKSGYTNSNTGTAAYTIGTALSAPTFSPGSGTYGSAQAVTLSEATPGATIYYTTNGSTPTTSSPIYAGPITVSTSMTVKATAIATGYSQSGVSSATYNIRIKKTPKMKLDASTASVTTAQPLTIDVLVTAPAGDPTPTGTVTLSSGSYTSSPVELNSGSATLSIPAGSLREGNDTLTATYTPDAASSSICTNATTTTTVTVVTANYKLAVPAVSVTPGQSTKATVTVSSSTGFTGSVNLTCSVTSSPAGAIDVPSCAGSNVSVALSSVKTSGTATVTLTTTGPSNQAKAKPTSLRGIGEGTALALLVLFGIPARRRKIQSLLCILILAGMMGGLAGCVATPFKSTTPTPTSGGTTAGNYTITVTGTGTDAAKSTAVTTFTLTVD